MPVAIGIDFGTESGRVVVVDLASGMEIGSAVVPYAHGVLHERLPSFGELLPPDYALQHPGDYLDVFHVGIPEALRNAKVNAEAVVGIGIDFTSCTVLPVLEDGTPMCLTPTWANHRHAWVKLWKHHAAQKIADRMTRIAEERHEPFLRRYGGRISSEWYFPKLVEVLEEDPELYASMYAFVEGADWAVWYLTGSLCRSSVPAGYKALWSPDEGLPDPAYFRAVHPALERPWEKLGTTFHPPGTRAGGVRPELAAQLGIRPGTAVAVGTLDSTAAVPGSGVASPGPLVMAVGTSICHLTVTPQLCFPQGITGVVRDAVVPGTYAYEAGQAAVGDMYAWLVRFLGWDSHGQEGFRRLEEGAAQVAPGSTGLLALDWWNGSRSVLADADLTGVVVGFTLDTTPAHLYRALLESTAFGTRRIVDALGAAGVKVHELVAVGGLALKSPVLMQALADISEMPVRVPVGEQHAARGAALYAAVAAGVFADIAEAAQALAPPVHRVYRPDPAAVSRYRALYQLYGWLHDRLGVEAPHLLHELKASRTRALGG
jgi:L-ribulokinase